MSAADPRARRVDTRYATSGIDARVRHVVDTAARDRRAVCGQRLGLLDVRPGAPSWALPVCSRCDADTPDQAVPVDE
jgi:hypothetical protein